METSGNVPASVQQQQQQQQQLVSMIRPEQVKRLPHLNDEKKQQHEVYIQRLWDNLRSNPQGSPDYQKALASLANISTSLMAGMKRYNAQRHQQQQQGLIAQQQAPSSSNETESFRSAGLGIQPTQILPHIQLKVSNYPFSLPPTMPEASAQAETWLREARNRLAQAMQRAEHAQKKKVDIQANAQARNQSGNPLTPQEHEALRNKMMQCNKVLAESNSFMEKFKDQQNQFRASAQQRYDAQNQANTAHGDNVNQAESSMPPGQPTPQSVPPPGGAPGGPQAHSISSAVSAARNRATSAAAANQPTSSISPTTSQPQPTQTPSGQQAQAPQQTPQPAMSQPNQNPNQSSGPAPFSAQSTFQQSATAYTTQSQPQSATHAHPPPNAATGFINTSKKEERPNIPKNLNVTAPRPVPMPPSRPTLNGGPGVGMPGQMGEPAIPVMPGYVLETSEDGRVLSRKKLNELAREVCGPGEDEKLTPEAEDVSLLP
jgi:transcription initiation factor TFIID subunit 12